MPVPALRLANWPWGRVMPMVSPLSTPVMLKLLGISEALVVPSYSRSTLPVSATVSGRGVIVVSGALALVGSA